MNIIDDFPISEACHLLAEMLHLLIIFQSKIQQIKQKLCGFDDFSVQTAFKQIDTQNKGYIKIHDIRHFLDKNIFPRDIQILFCNYGNLQRLSFLGFLRVIKPHFNKKLAEEIALRGKKRQLNPVYKALLIEILTLTFVMIGELQNLKLKLTKQFCLNPSEMRRLIFGKNVSDNQMTEVYKFIKVNGFDIEEDRIKFIECYLNSKIQLYDDHVMHLLFLPKHFKSAYSEQSDAIVEDKQVKNLPTLTKSNFLQFRYPGSSSSFVPLQLVSQAGPSNKQQNKNSEMRVLDGFLLKSQHLHRSDGEQINQIKSPRQNKPQPSYQMKEYNKQDQPNTPFLDMFLKSNKSSNFHHHKQSKNPSSSKNIELSRIEMISQTPIKINLGEPNSIDRNEYNMNFHLSPPILDDSKNVLDVFLKSPKIREQFDDSLSSESQSAFKYV